MALAAYRATDTERNNREAAGTIFSQQASRETCHAWWFAATAAEL